MPGLAVAAVGIVAMQQFAAISQVYRPSGDAPADDVRIATAQHSWLYGHLADRLTGTLAPRGQRELAPFGEVVFEMLDPSLMTAWASAHDENCKQARAEYLRDRMREFGWSTPPATPVPSVTTGSCPPDVGVLTFRSFR
jgi:hypothetical protein